MQYINTSINWEEFFLQESIALEEKMKVIDIESLNKSKIRICIEQNILDWAKYEQWTMTQLGCSSLKTSVNDQDLEKYVGFAKLAKETYSNYKFWNDDLLPLMIWNNQLIVLGLQYSDHLVAIKDHIFILSPPQVLSYLALRIQNNAQSLINADNENSRTQQETSMTKSMLDGVNFDASPPASLHLSSISEESMFARSDELEKNSLSSEGGSTTSYAGKQKEIWNLLTERDSEFRPEVKKHFDAYVILKIFQNKTQVFKMDGDLSKEGVGSHLFEYSLSKDNPFKKVFDTEKSESFDLKKIGIPMATYKYMSLIALKRGKNTVGFLVGLKMNQEATKTDLQLLEEVALEAS